MGVRTTARRSAAALVAAAAAVTLPALLPATAVGHAAPCSSAALACVDLSDNLSWLMKDGAVTYGPVPIRHGRAGQETPPGEFNVTFKNKDHVSSIYNSPMPNAVFFNGGIAFHQGNLESESAGCIRMLLEDSEVYFNTLQPGDRVEVVE